jgi:hypothetical protein
MFDFEMSVTVVIDLQSDRQQQYIGECPARRMVEARAKDCASTSRPGYEQHWANITNGTTQHCGSYKEQQLTCGVPANV